MSFFHEKVVLITGSSDGIGRATAVHFAREGAKVTVTGRNPEKLAVTKSECVVSGAKAEDVLELAGDVTDKQFLEKLVHETVDKFGRLDVLVNNVGSAIIDLTGKKGLEIPIETYDSTMDVNVRSVVIVSQLAIPYLEKTQGAIVNVSSIASSPFTTAQAYYPMSKACLDQLTVQMAGTLIKKGIRVNSVNPGIIRTNFLNAAGLGKYSEKIYDGADNKETTKIPLGKCGVPDDIAKMCETDLLIRPCRYFSSFFAMTVCMEPVAIIGIFLIFYCAWTLFLHGLVVTAVFLVRKQSGVNAFYTIYMVGCFADTLSLINGLFTYCSLTSFLQAEWFSWPIVVGISQTVVWGARFSQMLTVLIIASNRLTAIRYPIKHSIIWNRTAEKICAFVQIFSMFTFGGTIVLILRPKRIPSSFGGLITGYGVDTAILSSFFVGSTVLQTTNGLLVLACYAVILHDIRVTLKEIPIPSQSSLHHEQSLHKIALIVCVVEVLSVVQQLISTQFVTREINTEIYVVRTGIYTSIPPYLLILFSKNIRQRLISMFHLS